MDTTRAQDGFAAQGKAIGMNAFVLSGGGNLGSIQAGMIEALLEAGVYPDVLVGTSIGAANAAFLAADPSLAKARDLSELWRRVRPADIFPIHPLRAFRAVLRGGALFPTEPFRRFLDKELPYSLIEQAAVPLRIVAADFEDGSEVVFESGSVTDSILASTALPGVFAPYDIGGRLYLDGGLVDYVPVGPALAEGADTVYLLSVGFPCPPPADRASAKAVLMHSIGLLLSQRVRLDHDHLPEHHPDARIVRIPPVCTQMGLRDFSHTDELIERARTQTRLFLAGEECIGCDHKAVTADAAKVA